MLRNEKASRTCSLSDRHTWITPFGYHRGMEGSHLVGYTWSHPHSTCQRPCLANAHTGIQCQKSQNISFEIAIVVLIVVTAMFARTRMHTLSYRITFNHVNVPTHIHMHIDTTKEKGNPRYSVLFFKKWIQESFSNYCVNLIPDQVTKFLTWGTMKQHEIENSRIHLPYFLPSRISGAT